MSNPFSALVGSNEKTSENAPERKVSEEKLAEILEEIFSFTLRPSICDQKERILLDEITKSYPNTNMNLDILNQALFDRLFMCNSENEQIVYVSNKNFSNTHAYEHRAIIYLYISFRKLTDCKELGITDKEVIKQTILLNAATSIIQPDIYVGQSLPEQFVQILKDAEPYIDDFFVQSCRRVLVEESQNDTSLRQFIKSMCVTIRNQIIQFDLVNLDYSIFNCLKSFIKEEFLAEYLLEFSMPEKKNVGSEYANTALGAIFNLSILPKVPSGSYQHFTDPLDAASNSRSESILWTSVNNITQNIHSIIMLLLRKDPKVRDNTLTWIGDCLKQNANRGKIWSSQAPPEMNPANYATVTDGFMINMCNIMLRLCQPFTSNYKDKKVLKVDPTYCVVPNDRIKEKNIHIEDLSTETCLLPVETIDDIEEQRIMSDNYNFITECFFMAHKSIDLGFRVGVDKLIKLNHEMGRLDRTFNEARMGANQDLIDSLKDRMNSEVSKYLSLKCQLSDPILVKNMFDFISATCFWLCQVAIRENFNTSSYAPIEELKVNFPLCDKVPNTLKCIPEFILENVVSFLTFIRRFNPKVFEEQGYEKMEPILTFVLMFMGCQLRVKNPHLRARLAEGLESLLPYHKDEPAGLNPLGGYQREKLFKEHPHTREIVGNLLEVFVGIEMTGQSVEFEQKFNYRRPMYAVIEYLWKQPEQMISFIALAEYAENHMEAVNPPLFLRFANLLINDAIFLLDEALTNMAKIREMQHAQDNGQLNSLPARERTQQIGYLHHIGMLARFDNILGKDTIRTLVKLTSKIEKVFTHSTMVDRIAAMLNYFLLSLVGPNKQNFKVKDPQEFSFDPAITVKDICKIYSHLKSNDAFILAISQDGRSYSPQLFTYAEEVLLRIGGGNLLAEMKEIADRVESKAQEHKANEEALSEAPDHFLDPILSTLMTDPVILPSSKQTVDRSTIARHLLSDQTDPFNRSPLTMDQVIPNAELAEEIHQWLNGRTLN